ncbi:hypothetical protein ASL11_29035 [Paenibacillus sp. Soil750]|nr:hypothetical protein ASL11_29035 [Paenibacillus sp. Soil750]
MQIGNLFNEFHDNLLKSLKMDAFLHQFQITEEKLIQKVLFCIFDRERGLEGPHIESWRRGYH